MSSLLKLENALEINTVRYFSSLHLLYSPLARLSMCSVEELSFHGAPVMRAVNANGTIYHRPRRDYNEINTTIKGNAFKLTVAIARVPNEFSRFDLALPVAVAHARVHADASRINSRRRPLARYSVNDQVVFCCRHPSPTPDERLKPWKNYVSTLRTPRADPRSLDI